MDRQHPFELAVPVDPTDHVRGDPHARITLVEYGDFECPSCKQASSTVRLLLDEFRNRLRLVYRHFPLEEVHPNALQAAEAAEAAGAQGKFWEMHDLLFENQLHLQPNHLHAYAERLGLDMARFTTELDDEIYRQRVREHQASGAESGVRATPCFFVDGRICDVSYGVHTLYDTVAGMISGRAKP